MEQPINILIVDDEPKNLTVLESILDDPGYRLVRATSADQALLALVAEEFALLILDIRMPGMTGFQLAEMIKERKETASVPIIFLTAYHHDDQHVLAGYGTGAVDYLQKPVNATILRSKVAVFAELHRKSRSLAAEVAERRRAEQQLRELNETLDQRVNERTDALRTSEERYRAMIEAIPPQVWTATPDGALDHVNQRVLEYFECSVEQIIGAGWQSVIHPDDLPQCLERWSAALGSGEEYAIEFRLRRGCDGAYRWHLGRAVPVRDAAGQISKWFGSNTDITEIKEAEEVLALSHIVLERRVAERTVELRSAVEALETEITERRRLEREILEISEREQARLGQDLHDDLGQQLAGIGLFAFTLSEMLHAENHRCAADAQFMLTSLTSALHTARNLAKSLFPVELEYGGLTVALEELAQRTGTLTKVHFQLTVDPAFEIEKSSAIHLYRIVQESVSNAIKHSKAQAITIDCQVRDGVRTVRVTDDGVGFKEPEKDHEWAGMGLHLFQYRARLIGAEVEVKAMSDGKGCQVTCRFPPSSS